MTSNVFSRLVPTSQGRSFYEELRRRDDDPEDRAGLLDEENLNHDFHDYDLQHAEGLGVEDSRTTLGALPSPGRGPTEGRPHLGTRSTWVPQDDGDNEVPASLLVETEEAAPRTTRGQSAGNKRQNQAAAIPGSSRARAQWEATQAQQKLHDDRAFEPSRRGNGLPSSLFAGMVSGSAKKKAEWRWANVSNLDTFIKDVYDYYLGHGIWCILTERILHLV
jgi:autophagy-related protein 9